MCQLHPPSGAVTFLMNAQTLDALAFRVVSKRAAEALAAAHSAVLAGGWCLHDTWSDNAQDVVAKKDGRLLARAFISAETLAPLEGRITATLMTPQLVYAGTFRASFLVVTAADYLANDLSSVQRQRWRPELAKSTLDIGCAFCDCRKTTVSVRVVSPKLDFSASRVTDAACKQAPRFGRLKGQGPSRAGEHHFVVPEGCDQPHGLH